MINWYFDKLVLESFARIGVEKTVCQSLEEKFEFIKKEKVFFTEAFRSDDYNSLKEHDFELIMGFYRSLITRKTHKPLEEEIQFFAGDVLPRIRLYDCEMGPGRHEADPGRDGGQPGGSHAAAAFGCVSGGRARIMRIGERCLAVGIGSIDIV